MRTSAMRAPGFDRPLVVAGGGETSRWGYDPELECYWAEVHGPSTVLIGPEHLLVTLDSLARTLAAALGMADQDAYLALTAA